ncbi:MAG: hypothetical protein ACXW4Q_12195 [Anaerolineales bacterium]
MTIPIAFIYTLGAGMSGEDSSDLAVQVEVLSGLLFLILSIGISILAGVAGVIMLIAWAIKKNKTSND